MTRRQVARWTVGRTDGTTATMRARRTGDRITVDERHGRRWVQVHDVAATGRNTRALARQHQPRRRGSRR